MNEANAKILALDVGDERIGVAISDESGLIASPVTIIARKAGRPANEVVTIARRFGARTIVVGFPRNMDGSEGAQARKTRRFANRLLELAPDLEIVFWDERLSTSAAQKIFQETRSKKKRKQPLDSVSACVILQNYLVAVRERRCD